MRGACQGLQSAARSTRKRVLSHATLRKVAADRAGTVVGARIALALLLFLPSHGNGMVSSGQTISFPPSSRLVQGRETTQTVLVVRIGFPTMKSRSNLPALGVTRSIFRICRAPLAVHSCQTGEENISRLALSRLLCPGYPSRSRACQLLDTWLAPGNFLWTRPMRPATSDALGGKSLFPAPSPMEANRCETCLPFSASPC